MLALDHWMARLDSVKQSLVAHVSDIVKIEGFCRSQAGITPKESPLRSTSPPARPDARTLRHPDGVILDIGTHVLAMLRETVRYLGGSDDMTLQVVTAKDRLGREIATGDLTTAEGEAHLQGSISGVPVDIWLNKYAGPAGGQKGLRFHLRDGRIVSHDRRGAEDVLELIKGKEIQRWHIPGTIYEHCLAEHYSGSKKSL